MKVIEKNSVASQEQEDIDPRVGDRIRDARKSKGMTVRELAEKAGCSATLITRIELHQRRIDSMALMVSIAEALNIQVEELLTLAGQGLQGIDSYLRLAFPTIKHQYQEEAVSAFVKLITNCRLTEDELWQVLLNTTAMSEYFYNHRPADGNSK